MVSWRQRRGAEHRIGCRLALVAVVVVAAWLAVAGSASPAGAQELRFLRIGTGATGGTYFPVGVLIANAISSPPGSLPCDRGGSCGVPGVVAAAVATQGSVANAAAVAAGKFDLGLCQADVLHAAYSGAGVFAGRPLDNLRTIASLFPEQLHVVVRKDAKIASIDFLRRRRMNLGDRDSGTLVVAGLVAAAYGVAIADMQASYEGLDRATDLLIDGKIDGYFMVGGMPLPAVARAAQAVAVDLLAVAGARAQALIKRHPFLTTARIPAGTYQDVGEIDTLAVTAQLIVSAEMGDELAYELTRALWNPRNRPILDGGHPKGGLIRPETATRGLAAPLHPGAARYYAEAPGAGDPL
jgi:hypothetical protein